MEYVAAAYIAGDETLLEPLRAGVDFHQATADMIGVDRSVAKMVNFALLYGMAPKTLGGRLGVSTEKAKGYIEAIRSRAPVLASWCDEQVELADRGSPYTRTPLGRLRLVDQRYRPHQERWLSERAQMLNSPIQGSCADGYKLSAAMLWERRREFAGNPLLVNMIHDELVIEIAEDAAEQAAPLIEETMLEGMKAAFGPDIPVSVDITVSEAWVKG
jgi:DNA polymerase I